MQGDSQNVCQCVHESVSPLKKAITFDTFDWSAEKFSGSTPLFVSNFWAGYLVPEALGVSLGPQKCLFRQIYLLPGFWGRVVVSYLFGNKRTRQKGKSGILISGQPPKKKGLEGLGLAGWGGGVQPKFCSFSILFIKGTPTKIRRWFMQLFNFDASWPPGPRRVRIKSHN